MSSNEGSSHLPLGPFGSCRDSVVTFSAAVPAFKVHRTLRVTPAMAAGVTDRLWKVSDWVALIEAEERGLERAA
jgi:hypothetical protein